MTCFTRPHSSHQLTIDTHRDQDSSMIRTRVFATPLALKRTANTLATSKMSSNHAAWITAAKSHPLEVRPADLWTPSAHEVLIRNRAVAINPIDGNLQKHAWWQMSYPTILGSDVSGDVISVGSEVTLFKPGDRVVGFALGSVTDRPASAGFQLHTLLQDHMMCKIPDALSYSSAAVIPLGLSTAASGMFQPAPFLNLSLPSSPPRSSNGQSLLIWGGASSVGANAIQLAVAAGYEVITTCSPRNFDLVKSLGAAHVFDYNSTSAITEITSLFDVDGKQCAGALDCIGGAANTACVEIVSQVTRRGAMGVVASTKGGCETIPANVNNTKIFGATLKDNDVGRAVWGSFLPRALEQGEFNPAPGARVFGEGLEAIQGAVDRLMEGVSAEKIVVVL